MSVGVGDEFGVGISDSQSVTICALLVLCAGSSCMVCIQRLRVESAAVAGSEGALGRPFELKEQGAKVPGKIRTQFVT